jgi:hypothetical protein
LFAEGLFSSTHASATADVVIVVGAHISPWAEAAAGDMTAGTARTARTALRARRGGLMVRPFTAAMTPT